MSTEQLKLDTRFKNEKSDITIKKNRFPVNVYKKIFKNLCFSCKNYTKIYEKN
jgi:hypothetical protein